MREKKTSKEISVLDYMQNVKKLKCDPSQPLIVAKVPPKNEEEGGEGGAKGKKKGKGKAGGAGAGGSAEDSSKNRTPTWLLPEYLEFSLGERRKKDLSAQERSDIHQGRRGVGQEGMRRGGEGGEWLAHLN